MSCTHCGALLLAEAELALSGPAPSETIAASGRVETELDRSTKDDATSHREEFTRAVKRLGRFEVHGRVGGGGFGIVYRAFDPQLEREVALKVPRPGTLDSPDSVGRFLREAKAAAQLRHPHIVPIYDAGCEDGDLHYIASAFVHGQTLSAAVSAGPLLPGLAAQIVRDLSEALDYAHEQGVVHRDVKPSNVLLDEHDRPHLMDFGLARVDVGAEKLTRDGTVMGTPAYMSPEQANGKNDEVGPASDQYSLGALFYELLTGRAPFSGPPHLVLLQVVTQPPKSPRSINPEIPRDLETVCLKAMSREIGGRYASCADLTEDLNRWLRNEPVSARPAGLAERAMRWARRNPAIAGLTAATFLLLLVVATVSTLAALRLRALAASEREQMVRANSAANEARTATERANNEARLAKAETQRANAAAAQAREERMRAEALAQQNADLAAQERLAREQLELAVKRAEEESGKATLARTEATTAQKTAIETARRSAVSKYIEEINAAEREWQAADANAVAERLRRTEPSALGGLDLRGPEWHLLDRFARGYDRLLTRPGATMSEVVPVACSETRNEILCGPFPPETGEEPGATVVAFRIPDGKPVWTAKFPGPAVAAAYPSHGDRCHIVAANGLYAVELGELTSVPEGEPTPLEPASLLGQLESLFEPQSAVAKSLPRDSTRLAPVQNSASLAVEFSRNGEWLCVSNGSAARWFPMRGAKSVRANAVRGVDTRSSRFAFSEDSDRLAYVENSNLIVRDLETGDVVVDRSIKLKQGFPWRIVAYSARDEIAVALPGPVGISTKTGLARWSTKSESLEDFSARLADSGKFGALSVVSRSGRVQCLDIKSGRKLASLATATTGSSLVVPGGRQVALSTRGGVALYSLSPTGEKPETKAYAWLQSVTVSNGAMDELGVRLGPGHRDSSFWRVSAVRNQKPSSPRSGFLKFPSEGFGNPFVEQIDTLQSVRYPLKAPATAVARSYDGRAVVFGDDEGKVWRFDLLARTPPAAVGSLSSSVVAVDTNSTGSVAALDLSGTVKLWSKENIETATASGFRKPGKPQQLVIRLSTDGSRVAIADDGLSTGVHLISPDASPVVALSATSFRATDGKPPKLKGLAVARQGVCIAVLDHGERVTLWRGADSIAHFVKVVPRSNAGRESWESASTKSVEFDATGERLVVVREGRLDFVHSVTGRLLLSFSSIGEPTSGSLSYVYPGSTGIEFDSANNWCRFHANLQSRRFDCRPLDEQTRGEREAMFAAAYHGLGSNTALDDFIRTQTEVPHAAIERLRNDRTLTDAIRDQAIQRLTHPRSEK